VGDKLRRAGLAAATMLALTGPVGCGSGGHGPRASTFAGATFPSGLRAHDFRLLDQDGGPVSLRANRGHVVVLAFLARGLRARTLAAQQIRGALDEVGTRAAGIRVLLIASPSAGRGAGARAFLRAVSLQGRASYLTGSAARLRAVWHAYGVVLPSAGERAFIASPTVLLVDRSGFERVGFALEQLTPEGLAHDIRLLLAGV
jgi:protein SCO1